ncbi:hypothetical protein GPECTOR_1g70 [Gonium pectorale]|uniref:Uncharacterized protein n=1 Tax=Gonium pectorale TaxID=33097 RepID=A0A150H3N1_GONPE|nr:hypothetical protein GPECTOR_1g70 [Gonium pectorale]|eukprot:KXZ56777.1 hypothetical protein GPECTOR_1g70 [Gonium pectorale]
MSALDAGLQVRPALRSLRSAGLSAQESWFLVGTSRPARWRLLEDPAGLSRWLDFLSVYGMKPRDIQNFLLRAPPGFLGNTTLYQAGSVVTFLKSLRLSDDLLATRVLCVWPGLLGREVEAELRPVVGFLMSLGLEVADVGRVAVLWPELLMCSVEGQLRPWVDYLRGLGCTTPQVADVICLCPHLLGFSPEEVFGGVLRALEGVGLARQDVARMVTSSVAFLIAPSASATVAAALECLLQNGFSKEQVRELVSARPELLASKPHDLERSLRFVRETIGGDTATVMGCPLLLAKPLGQALGPRYSFIQKRGLADKYIAADGISFEVWDEEYSLKLHQEAATEFQEELKKLGIYEGS